MRILFASLSILAFTPLAMAAAPVEDLSARQTVGTSQSQGAPAVASSPMGDLYYQLQVLQEEVRELRGAVDEQSNELRRLRQQQMDDYQDLDRRIGGASARPETSGDTPQVMVPDSSPLAAGTAPEASQAQATQQSSPVGADSEAERRSYDAAYELLKNRHIEQSVVGFKEHLERFPQGSYAANAHYWLGEIYLLQNDLSAANLAFSEVVNNFPAHSKMTDAKFKLGRVLHLQGQDERARTLLQEVAATNSSAADLARNYLAENF